ncbi:hypothetical protein RQP46_006386 [Phenoliferia psychrophenolica]
MLASLHDLESSPSASASSPPPPERERNLPFPPEVLLLIVAETTSSDTHNDGEDEFTTERNSTLVRLALVSSEFQRAVQTVLYGDLRLVWFANRVKLLFDTLERNPSLLLLIRSIEASSVMPDKWCNDRVRAEVGDRDNQENYWEDYCDNMDYSDGRHRQEWKHHGGLPPEVAKEWEDQLLGGWEAQWKRRGLGRWDDLEGVSKLGAGEVLDLVDKAPNVRKLVLNGFRGKVRDDIKTRGPFPTLRSLETFPGNPFTSKHISFASHLITQSPNLRHLVGSLRDRDGPTTVLPPLQSLDLFLQCRIDATLERVLSQTRSTLCHLKILWRPHAGDNLRVAPYLSSLETLDLTLPMPLPRPDLHLIGTSLSTCTLLHLCLNLFPFPDTLLSSIPPCLLTLSLTGKPRDNHTKGFLDAARAVLKALQRSKSRPSPLRVQFTTETERTRRKALRGFQERYRAEGLMLVVVVDPRMEI